MTSRRMFVLAFAALGVGWLVKLAVTERTRPVEAARALDGASSLGLAAPGRVEPAGEERVLSARAPGTVSVVRVEENAVVTAGQVLAELDRDELEAQLRADAATLALEQAARARLVHGARPEERREANADLAQAEAQLAHARDEHARRTALQEGGAVAAADLSRAAHELAAAEARREQAKERAGLIGAPTRSDELTIADARVARAEALVDTTKALIEKTYVRSPIAGTVLQRMTRAGESVGVDPPTPLFVIGDLSRLCVRAEIDELDVARVRVGQRAVITADAYPGKKLKGTVGRVAQRVGSRRVFTERPTERQDSKALDALITLDPGNELPVGLRVDVFLQ